MNKKAAMKPIVKIVIFLVVIAVLSLFLLNIEKTMSLFVDKNTCKTAVRANAMGQAQVAGTGILEAYKRFRLIFEGSKTDKGTEGIKCPIQDVTIKDNNKEVIKQRLADTMYDCMDNFGFGTLKLFEPKPGEEKYCVICHNIKFEGQARNQFIRADEFDEFLETKHIDTPSVLKDTFPYKRISYKQTFAGYLSDEYAFKPKEKEEEIRTSDYGINTAIPYATIFTYTKKGYWSHAESGLFAALPATIITAVVLTTFTGGGSLIIIGGSLLSGTTTGAIGYQFGHSKLSDWDAGIVLMPYDQSQSTKLDCTYLPGKQE
jgi:hypothetical protein